MCNVMDFTWALHVKFKSCAGLRHHPCLTVSPPCGPAAHGMEEGWLEWAEGQLRDTQRHRQLAAPSVWCSIMGGGIICFITSPSGSSLCGCSRFVQRFSCITPTMSKMPIINMFLLKNQAHEAKSYSH